MRPYELLLIGTVFLSLVVRFLPSQRWGWILNLLAMGVMGLQLFKELPRWQMVPVYVVTLIFFIASLPIWWETAQRPGLGWTLLGMFVLVLVSLPPYFFPIPTTITPTGPYQVGTSIFEWVDESRDETLAGAPVGKRRLMVQVWYPAVVEPGSVPVPYLSNLAVQGPAAARVFKLPPFALSHVNLAATHAYLDPPVVKGTGPLRTDERFPVLVFSHGWTGFRVQNTYQMEELASQGYVVFAPDHTYGAAATAFLDGSVAYNRPELLPTGVSDAVYNEAAAKLGQVWVSDIGFVLDQAKKLDTGEIISPLKGKMDLGTVGVFGHSMGGGAAVQFCDVDSRCKAGLAMDAWLVPYSREIPQKGLTMPFFFFQSENWPNGANAELLPALFDHMQGPAWRLTIAGARHYNFTDIALLTPLSAPLGITGTIDGSSALKMINAYSVAYFDTVLRRKPPSTLLIAPSPDYPETHYEQK
jgi:predicted dienelactone hydrolase